MEKGARARVVTFTASRHGRRRGPKNGWCGEGVPEGHTLRVQHHPSGGRSMSVDEARARKRRRAAEERERAMAEFWLAEWEAARDAQWDTEGEARGSLMGEWPQEIGMAFTLDRGGSFGVERRVFEDWDGARYAVFSLTPQQADTQYYTLGLLLEERYGLGYNPLEGRPPVTDPMDVVVPLHRVDLRDYRRRSNGVRYCTATIPADHAERLLEALLDSKDSSADPIGKTRYLHIAMTEDETYRVLPRLREGLLVRVYGHE